VGERKGRRGACDGERCLMCRSLSKDAGINIKRQRAQQRQPDQLLLPLMAAALAPARGKCRYVPAALLWGGEAKERD